MKSITKIPTIPNNPTFITTLSPQLTTTCLPQTINTVYSASNTYHHEDVSK
ncbi:hypothetical protein [Prevotella fusca]|uniref:hypothetical protein n=1 Tax=Prevotella fusca TaxID=589436 RepID=UPI00131EF5A6|nr:hypothetical protein [Prevotella fusca]